MKKLFVLLSVAVVASFFCLYSVSAEKNMVWGYGVFGKNNVMGYYGGADVFYTRDISSRVDFTGGVNLTSKRDGFGGLLAEVRYRLPVRGINVFFSGRGVYNYYAPDRTHEYLFRIAVHARSQYFDIVFGNSFLGYSSFGSSVFEPITWSIGIGANIKKRDSRWNIGAYVKNYDYFIYENWNINFGIRGWYDLNPRLRLTGNFMVRPAGSINQLAMKYDTSIRLGVNYKW